MKIIICISLLFIISCKPKETIKPEQLLTSKQWKLDRFSDANRKTLSANQVDAQAIVLFAMQFEFRADNVTRAREVSTKQIINAGTWSLTDTIIDIDVTGFKGKFTVIEIGKTNLVLRDDSKKLLKNQDNGNLEFVAVL